MKILVFSDSHHCEYNIDKMLSQNPNAELMIFLGDGEYDLQNPAFSSPEKAFIGLRGNCDYSGIFPQIRDFEVENIKFFCTHGHLFQVKTGLSALKKAAGDKNADIVLFGHTHIQMTKEEDGIIFLNPGSLKNGHYAVIEALNGVPKIFLRRL